MLYIVKNAYCKAILLPLRIFYTVVQGRPRDSALPKEPGEMLSKPTGALAMNAHVFTSLASCLYSTILKN